jgi:predicted histone-like DNA-binding protein
MALKVKAKEREMKIGKNPGVYRYVMLPELYSTLDQDKVISEAAIRSGVTEGVMRACWEGAGKVIKAWATEGHSVALPGLGTMRFGLRAKAVEDVNDVKASLIKTRRIIFTPTQELKDELADTAIQITCYDRNGEEVKRVTSADPGTVEDPEAEQGSGTGGNTSGGNTNGGSTGGNTNGGYNGGGGDGGEDLDKD